MARAVLISICPERVNRIISGEKTVEIRKTRPKLGTLFKCYIYETQGKSDTPWIDADGHMIFRGRGKVVGEFVCDKIDVIQRRDIPENFDYCYLSLNECVNDDIETEIRDIMGSCIQKERINSYVGKTPVLYAWHISNLKIYDNSKQLSKFWRPFENRIDKVCDEYGCAYCENGGHIKSPPQSWCYVDELGNG